MVTRALIKTEIDKVNDIYLDLIYELVKALESSNKSVKVTDKIAKEEWFSFINKYSGSLANAPIQRPVQGSFEERASINEISA
jgi:hypothetical protein